MIFLRDKFGKLNPPRPKLQIFLVLLVSALSIYNALQTAKLQEKLLIADVEKASLSILYTEIKEENLEYYLFPPYCGYEIKSKKININNLQRDRKNSNFIQKEYITSNQTIKVTVCYDDSKIKSKLHTDIFLVITLLVMVFLLIRRQYANEKAKFFRQQTVSPTK